MSCYMLMMRDKFVTTFLSSLGVGALATMTNSCDTTVLDSMANNANELLYAYDEGTLVTTFCHCGQGVHT